MFAKFYINGIFGIIIILKIPLIFYCVKDSSACDIDGIIKKLLRHYC